MFWNKKTILLLLASSTALAINIAKADFIFGTPVNLGPAINTSAGEMKPNISSDDLSLFFGSNRRDGYGGHDIWVTTRATTNDDWGIPVNLGPTINSPSKDSGPSISVDGLSLFFDSVLAGGYGDTDIWAMVIPTYGCRRGQRSPIHGENL
ncbi:MAG: TolB-like translocation protein [Planctomycetota bacterium]|jgi:Tol biopolymer transport system component